MLFFVDEEGQHGRQPRSEEILSDPLKMVKSKLDSSSSELDDSGIRIAAEKNRGSSRSPNQPVIVEVGKAADAVKCQSNKVTANDPSKR